MNNIKHRKRSAHKSTSSGNSTMWAVLVGGIIIIIGAVVVYFLLSNDTQDNTDLRYGENNTSSYYNDTDQTSTSNSPTAATTTEENKQPTTTTDGIGDLEGKPFAVVKGVVQTEVSSNLYLVGSEDAEVVFLAYFPSATLTGEITDLDEGDLIALSGQIQKLPTASAMQTRWDITLEESQSLHTQVSWYVEVTKVVPRDNANAPN